jgi:hypothetical protein
MGKSDPYSNFGFLMTRHVTNEITNKYWNRSILCIRTFYPTIPIVIIDDNSNLEFVKPTAKHTNVIFIKSEFKGAGELLPYYYYLKHAFFKYAVIIHDSVFIHKKIRFREIAKKYSAMTLWHFEADNILYENRYSLMSHLTNGSHLINQMKHKNDLIISPASDNWRGSFGGQSFISHDFLLLLEKKYKFTNLLKYVKNRTDRMSFERIIGILITNETKYKRKSLFGNIHSYQTFGYSYEKYVGDFNKGQLPRHVVKVWTGR